MRSVLLNLVLAITWGAMTGSFQVENLLIGFSIGFVVLAVAQRRDGGAPPYAGKVWGWVQFIGFYLWELLLANFRVAHDVLTRERRSKPGIIAIRLDARTDAEITLFANLLTMTPGDLSIDVSTDRRVLYVHSLYLDDMEESRREIEDGFEARVLKVMR
jgi:multicomponent Na+:H+ antiporter subunit E